MRDDRVLLGQRARAPFKGWWDIPGGFLNPWEHPEAGALREVREETGLRIRTTDLLGVFIDRYRMANRVDYTLNIYYRAEVIGGSEHPADDLAALEWFAPDALPRRIAFENGRKALQVWRAACS